MAVKKFLDINGFKHFIEKVIGKTDISEIGDGTVKGAIKDINSNLDKTNESFNTYKNKTNITVAKKTPNDLAYVANYKSGIVTIRGYAWTRTSGVQNTAILTIPTAYAPKDYDIPIAGGVTNNGTDFIGYGITSLSKDGKLNIKYSTGAGFVFFDFCYAI